jgi:hypothetical protein
VPTLRAVSAAIRDDVVAVDPEVCGDLVDGGRASGPDRQFVDRPAHGDVELFGAAGHLHRPGRVPEVALDLAFDRAAGERRERHPDGDVETVDRLDQRQHRHLLDVTVAARSVLEAAGDVDRQAHVLLDDPVPDASTARPAILLEQLGGVSRHRALRRS